MKRLLTMFPSLPLLSRRAFASLGLAVLTCSAIPSVQAHDRDDDDHDNDDHGRRHRCAQVVPPHARPFGLTYGEWQTRWWQWSISIPWSIHPYQSAANAANNQSGPVWFLVGYTDGGVREVTIPRGKAIFFPVVNVECSNVEVGTPFFGANEAEMRAACSKFVRSDMECFIDGKPVCNLERFEGESPLFCFNAPDDNILIGAGPVSGQAVSAGTYVMVPPLSPGHHVIEFKGTQTDPVFGASVYGGVYHITVPRGGRH